MSADTYIPRIESDWNKYYENDPIVDEPIAHLTKIQLEAWILKLIRNNNMTKTNYYNVSLIIRQIFQFAYDSEIIQNNTFSRVKKDLGKFFKKERKPEDATLAFRETHGIKNREYIFSTSPEPMPWSTINDYLERYCKRLGICYRSSHKLRKTALSSLVNSGISLNAVRNFSGHVDERTTLKYYTYDRETDDSLSGMFEDALSFNSGKN